MRAYVGTSGYSYEPWVGSFYPAGTKAGDMLGLYAQRLRAVELNNTFYRLPKRDVFEAWARAVPEHFRFAIKVPRHITHQSRLVGCEEPVRYLLEGVGALGSRLGLLLVQLPPNFRADRSRLEAFVSLLPSGTRAAFEFRHPSWLEPVVLDLLRQHNLALAWAHDGASPGALERTASYGYARLRAPSYSDSELDAWASHLRAAGFDESYAFFKHEDAGVGPALAAALQARLG